MAVVQLSPIGNAAQFFSANGTPLNAGTLTTYAAGTSTPQTTYTTNLGAIANSNPIVLGVDGRPPQEIWLAAGSAYKFVLADGLGNIIATYDNIAGIPTAILQSSYIGGLGLSTAAAGNSSTMAIAAGTASDSQNVVQMRLATAISKTTASWSLGSGAGGLDAGVIANITWYHFFLIYRADTGATDVLISLSATGPTLPTNYTNFRRIGSGKTNLSGQWQAFIQDGDYFQWRVTASQGGASLRPFDFNTNNPGTAAISTTLAVPTGVNVIAQIKLLVNNVNAGSACALWVSDLDVNDAAVQTVPGVMAQIPFALNAAGFSQYANAETLVRTNTLAQVRVKVSYSSVDVTIIGAVIGWFDRRGRDS